MDRHNLVLWVLQWFFGIYFVLIGVMHFIVPEGLPAMMSWMYDLDGRLHAVSGAAEILGGLGLILPGLTKIKPQLTAYAAFGLALVMLGAFIWHAGRGETPNMVTNFVVASVMVYLGYARLKLRPLVSR